jgi:hypothetical protein
VGGVCGAAAAGEESRASHRLRHRVNPFQAYAALVGSPPPEVLVALHPGAAIEDAVPDGAEVVQRMPPRLAIVVADTEALHALTHSPAVSGVYPEDVPGDVLDGFDQVTRVFAAGWNERRRPKRRRGEGLSWDAPGFEAP